MARSSSCSRSSLARSTLVSSQRLSTSLVSSSTALSLARMSTGQPSSSDPFCLKSLLWKVQLCSLNTRVLVSALTRPLPASSTMDTTSTQPFGCSLLTSFYSLLSAYTWTRSSPRALASVSALASSVCPVTIVAAAVSAVDSVSMMKMPARLRKVTSMMTSSVIRWSLRTTKALLLCAEDSRLKVTSFESTTSRRLSLVDSALSRAST